MSAIVEIVRVRARDAGALLGARPAMLADFRADRVGFLTSNLIRLTDDEFLDVVWWRNEQDLAVSRAKGPNRPGIAAFFATIAEVISDEKGSTAEVPVADVGR